MSTTEIREFLVACRARVQPADVGLPSFGGRRHVKGLRREEVAVLAGVSTEYYARLERGALAGVSDQVLAAVADALQLSDTERDHLTNLARAASTGARRPRRDRSSTPGLPVALRAAVQAITGAPAFIRNGALDILTVNDLGRAYYAPMFAAGEDAPNIAKFIVFDPAAREFFPSWQHAVDGTVAILRYEAGRNPFDPRITEVIGELSTRSELFRDRWANAVVHRHAGGLKVIRHPVVGDLSLHLTGTEVMSDPGLSLMIYAAEPGTEADEKLRLLASWAATRNPQGADALTAPGETPIP